MVSKAIEFGEKNAK